MTISATYTPAQASGNGATVAFPFTFKTFEQADLVVIITDANDVDTTQTITTHYTVSLNADQNNNPGGTVTMLTAPASGTTLTIAREIDALQETDIANGGGFYPEVLEDAFDRLTMLSQQNSDAIDRSFSLPVTVSGVNTELPVPAANNIVGWNATADALQNFDPSVFATVVSFGTAKADIFDGDGVTLNFTLSANPGAQNNLDVSISGVTQTPGIDYTWTAGTTISFVVAPPAGTDNVLVRYMQGLANTNAQDATYTPDGATAVETTIKAKLREVVSVKDFGARGDGVTDDTSAIQAAITYAKTFSTGCEIVFPEGKYLYSTLLVDAGNISIVGRGLKGSWLLKSGTTGDGLRFVGSSRIFGNKLSNILFSQASGNASSGSQVVFENCGQVKLENVFVQNITHSPYIGVTFQSCSQTDKIEGLAIQGCLNHGAVFKDCLDTMLSNCRSDANGAWGWYFSTCSGVYATNVTGYLNALSAFVADAIAATSTSDGNHYHFYSNCIGDTSGQYNWAFTGLSDSGLTGCWGATQSGAGDYTGFAVNACTRVEFSKCIAKNNNGHGLWAFGACDAIVITGGHYSDNGKTVAGRNGIQIECPNVIVNGATCTDSRAGGSKTQDSGIGITTNCNQAVITNNRFVGNKTTPYDIVTTAMTSFFEDNNVTDQSLSVASAGTLILPAIGKCFTITGTTTINVIGNVWPQREVNLVFTETAAVGATGVMKLVGTFNPTANDTLCMFSDGTNWYEKSRSVNV